MLKQRILTAVILVPLALAGLFLLEGGAFALFTGAVVLLAAWEWTNLAGLPRLTARLAVTASLGLAMLLLWAGGSGQATGLLWLGAAAWLANLYWVTHYPERRAQWATPARRLIMGLTVLLPCWVGFNSLRASGGEWLLFVLLLVWLADTGAYFAGRAFGRRKLAPAVSPGKTWEGVAGGVVVTSALALCYAVWLSLGLGETLGLMLATVLVTLVSVLGDLFESMLKRTRGVKDSGVLLPGHGGVLDRIDSLTAAIPIFALLRVWL
ncbi:MULTISPECIES: phosphatidate cytidylyltransferase [Halomonadaceae]|uniref:phosphatidate cytidylyltransferase n=1 Tax=Halomonadaceae TaxID=28256 RepID=UPI001582CD4C|nr:phosphatidate cytidylyltransferase [Halomonas sp. BMC7]MDI4637282.1 phosphatidate cytidylyltransferase [Halomonas sp. BMC7]NUJ58450.1 phosphatidate cytidylyltransferase [Halomonas taeanensis]